MLIVVAWAIALLCIVAGVCILVLLAGKWRRIDEIAREYRETFNQNSSK